MRMIKILVLLIFSFIIFSKNVYAVDPISTPWSISLSNLPNTLASQVSTLNNNRLFIFGGANTDDYSQVYASNINIDNTLTSWVFKNNLPETRYWMAKAQKGGNVYVLGGTKFDGAPQHVNSVYKASISPDGSISSWQNLNVLPQVVAQGGATVVGDWLYFAGGRNDSGRKSTIYYAPINPDGTIGSWLTSAIALPATNSGLGMLAHGNNIYILGGVTPGGVSNKVYKTTVNTTTGAISAWQELASLPEGIDAGNQFVIVDKTIISAGGGIASGLTNKVHYTNINPDGTLNPWATSSQNLPKSIGSAALVQANGYLYLIGGINGVGYLNSVYYTKLNFGGSDINLSVPFFSQNASSWGKSEYDHAKSLGFKNPTMDRWGCAVTSAAMVMNYHGMTKFQNNSALNPGSLNTWLKNNGGYLTGKGIDGTYSYLLLPSIGKLSKILFDAGKSTTKLEHKREKNIPTNLLKADLDGNIPAILKVKNSTTTSHFVVAKGYNDDTYLINDPEWNYPDLTSFNNTYQQIDRYIPSNTDLSYITIVVNPDVEIFITDPAGNQLGKYIQNGNTTEENGINDASYGFQDPISNPNNAGNPENLGVGVNELLIPQPQEEGVYNVKLTSDKTAWYTVNIVTFEEDGTQKTTKISGVVGPNNEDEYNFNFSKNGSSNVNQDVTFDNFVNDVNSLCDAKEITFALCVGFKIQANTARELSKKSTTLKGSTELLKSIQKQLKAYKGKGVSDSAYEILNTDIQILLSSL